MNNLTSNSLIEISEKINLYGNLFILIIGNASNLIKIIFFLQKSLRHNSCSYYILAGTFADLLFINNQPMIRILRQLKLVGSMSSLECPIRSYLQTLSFSLSFTFLILAAFDRFWSTSRRYTYRKLSNPHTARHLIQIVTLSWIIFNTHHLFHHRIHNNVCTARFAHRFVGRFMLLFFCIVPLTLLTINILTIINLQSMRHPIQSRINIQLTLLILSETLLTTISILPQTMHMAYFQIMYNISRSSQRRLIEQFLDVILRVVAYSECSIGFIVYLLFLSRLRRKFFQSICFCQRQRPINERL